MTDARYFLGIDGGGSGCRARLIDEAGHVLGEGRAGPANLRLGAEAVWAAIEAAAAEAIKAADAEIKTTSVFVTAGLAGTSRRDVLAELEAQRHNFASLNIVEDTVIACLGAHSGRDGGIVIAGTGSVGLALLGNECIRVGGYGFPLSDEGSGADLGLEALRMAMQCLDGRIKATPLLDELCKHFSNDASKFIAWMDRAGPTEYAGFAERVVSRASAGDATALALVCVAAARIESLVTALLSRGAPRIALMGGLAAALEPHMSAATRAWLYPPDGDALTGALILARRSAVSE